MVDKNCLHELGIGLKDREVLLFYTTQDKKGASFQVVSSSDGLHFNSSPQRGQISSVGPQKENLCQCGDFRVSKAKNNYLLTYNVYSQKHPYPHLAFSLDLLNWEKIGKFNQIKGTVILVPDYEYQGKSVVYFGEKAIQIAFSKNLKTWEIAKQPVLEPRKNYFDDNPLELIGVIPFGEYILVIYSSKKPNDGSSYHAVGAAIFDKRAPEIILWRSDKPIWVQPEKWQGEKIYPLGAVYLNERILLYWKLEGRGVFVVSCLTPGQTLTSHDKTLALLLKKFVKNPIIKPVSHHAWESKATFNTAALYEDGKVHFIYRAIGDDDISVFGYASSKDGLHIDERSDEPIYVPTQHFECPDPKRLHIIPSFISGGSYGGCEDPRITKIGKRLYMTYVAFNGASPPRVALTSIEVDDFLAKRWSWEKPILISPPGVVDKNACLLPEKIRGKYVVFHRIFPNILIDFVDDLNFNDYLKGEFLIKPREDSWDSLKVGAGAPPMKTNDGWLLIYHAVGWKDRGRYKIGAMLLEQNDPTHVLYRSNSPILEPTESYENEGHKSGIAYPCGAAILKEELLVYYGGADTVVCAAHADLKTFLCQLKSSHSAKLAPVSHPLKLSVLN